MGLQSRRRLIPFLVLFGCLAIACSPEPAPGESEVPLSPVRVSVQVDKAVATTGDLIEYSIEIDHAEGVVVEIPESGAEISGFRIVDTGQDPPRTEDGRVRLRSWYKLRADLLGSYILPALVLNYTNADGVRATLETSQIFVEVASVLPEDGAATDIRDVKALREIESPWPWVWIVLGVALLCLVLGWLWWRRRSPEADAVASRPPHEIAFDALSQLRSTDFQDLASLRRYYFEISEVVRTYVEGRFGLNATDLTTEEIVPRLSGLVAVEEEDRLRRFLVETDGVKFAAQRPSEAEIEATYESALLFVESTVPEKNGQETGQEIGQDTGEDEGEAVAGPSGSSGSSEPSSAGEAGFIWA